MILLIDGNNLAFIHNSVGSSSRADGFPTQAITGFLKAVRSYCVMFEATKVFVAWDGGKSRQRMALLPGYKDNRKVENKTPEQKMNLEEVILQIPVIAAALENLGCYQISGRGIEGDDLIALMAKRISQAEKKSVIISSDSDFHQLVNPQISVYSAMNKKEGRHATTANFSAIHGGLRPDQFLEYKALMGDSSDDVPGVKGIGPETAKKLLVRFGSVESWRRQVETKTHKPTKTEQKIVDQWEMFQISKSMIDLQNPLADYSTAQIVRKEPDILSFRALTLEYQLSSIFTELQNWVKPFKDLT